jgi:hypothetical protein
MVGCYGLAVDIRYAVFCYRWSDVAEGETLIGNSFSLGNPDKRAYRATQQTLILLPRSSWSIKQKGGTFNPPIKPQAILKPSSTITDLEYSHIIKTYPMTEALQYRHKEMI